MSGLKDALAGLIQALGPRVSGREGFMKNEVVGVVRKKSGKTRRGAKHNQGEKSKGRFLLFFGSGPNKSKPITPANYRQLHLGKRKENKDGS